MQIVGVAAMNCNALLNVDVSVLTSYIIDNIKISQVTLSQVTSPNISNVEMEKDNKIAKSEDNNNDLTTESIESGALCIDDGSSESDT